ncbi:hypothetical protein J4E80_004511 [Alternaria sp. BMP 0032]|nr:hypothetical protein J4E80_004511 [Alternaria sp. BMP 0032]
MGNWFSKAEVESTVDTVSLGMVVIDEIHLPHRSPLVDVAGGSGTYATLGSRLFVTPARSKTVGCLALVGYDFPRAVREQLLAWQTTLHLKVSQDRLSTRGLLEYEDDTFGPKKFRYTTEPLKASPIDLVNTHLLGSEAFHLLAPAEVVEQQIPELLKLRMQHGLVDVFSPNHLEMSAMFEDSPSRGFQPDRLETYALEFSKATGPHGSGIVIVRAGEHGSLTTQNAAKNVWLPPYYQSSATKVVDPTGGGNTYLGGFIEGWKASRDITEASMYGNVAASFAIEQIGLPSCEAGDGEETWNGVRVMQRLSEYKEQLSST